MNDASTRTYLRYECAVFRKTAEIFGGLSNMAPGYPIRLNGVRVFTAEALYQACRFPHRIEVQRLIIGQNSPMTAKMVSKPYRDDSRPDWDQVRVKVMRWCLRIKLATHFLKFSELLLSTGSRPIVEDSRKDAFWGAIPGDTEALVGRNVLGRLLMELREEIKRGAELRRVEPPAISNFLLFGEHLGVFDFRTGGTVVTTNDKRALRELPLPLFGEETALVRRSLHPDLPRPAARRSPIEGLKPYSKYKDSGVPWLGEIPSNWDVRRGKWLFQNRKELNTRRKDKNVLSLTLRGVVNNDPNDPEGLVPNDYATYQLFKRGDLVFKLIDLENLRTSRVGLVPEDGIMSSAYVRLIPHNGGNIRFFFHQYFDLYSRGVYNQIGGGVRSTLGANDLLDVSVLFPSPDEQDAIVRFLDHANARIERAIRAKKKLIALLDEQKQAIIHRAVTRGLDPNVPLKSSGIPWLGDIPKRWEMNALRRHWKVTDCKHLTVPFVEDGIPLASVVEVQSFTLDLSRCKKTRPASYRHLIDGDRKPRRGDLIYCRNASVGACALVETDIDFAMGQDVCLIRSELQNQRFLNYQLHSPFMKHQLELILVGSTFKRINVADIKALTVLVPLREEQDAISTFLDSRLTTYDTAISRAEREIGLLREYRTRLVTDVVTGKLDVRTAARQLPVDADESATPVSDKSEKAELVDEEQLA